MYGAIIGDIAGSIYEYDEFNNSENGIINNGCMMRIAPIGFMFNSLEEVEENAELATIPSHRSMKVQLEMLLA